MQFTVKNKNNNTILYTGTRPQCVRFARHARISNNDLLVEPVDASFYASSVEEIKKPFFKRIFKQ